MRAALYCFMLLPSDSLLKMPACVTARTSGPGDGGPKYGVRVHAQKISPKGAVDTSWDGLATASVLRSELAPLQPPELLAKCLQNVISVAEVLPSNHAMLLVFAGICCRLLNYPQSRTAHNGGEVCSHGSIHGIVGLPLQNLACCVQGLRYGSN